MVRISEMIEKVKELGATHFYFSADEQDYIPGFIGFDLCFDTAVTHDEECYLCLKKGPNSIRFDYLTDVKCQVLDDGVIAITVVCEHPGRGGREFTILAT